MSRPHNSNKITPLLSPACFLLLVALLSISSTAAQSPVETLPGAQMLAEYFRRQTAHLRDRCLTNIHTLEQWQKKRPLYRKQLLEMLGLDPLPARTDLKPTITRTIQHDDFIVENLHFQSLPGLYVTANLYIPAGLQQPAPTILYLCGHARVKINDVSYGNKTHYQHHAAWFARHGYVCLIIDSLQLGEIEGTHHGTYRYDMWWWNCRGYTPAGVEAYNCIRALDYLQTRKEVDPNRIGVTGRSGGGAYSWWIAAIDDRIKVAVPVAGITDMQNHIVDGCVEGHCDCMYFLNTYQWDFPLVAALVAPRPLLISNTDKDAIFPLDGVVRLYEKLRRIYRLYDAERNLGLHITEGPHKDTQPLRIGAFAWFNRFLKNDTSLIDSPATAWTEPNQLKVFDTLPTDQINTKIHESFVPRAPVPKPPQTPDQWARQRRRCLHNLRSKCFRCWPARTKALQLKQLCSTTNNNITLTIYQFTSQEPFRLNLYLLQHSDTSDPDRLVLHLLDQQRWEQFLSAVQLAFPQQLGTADNQPEPNQPAFEHLTRCLSQSRAVFAYFAPRGIGPTRWTTDPREQTHIRRRFMLLGQTLDAMRLYDTCRAIAALREIDTVRDLPLTITATDTAAGLALYAALFEPAVDRLQLYNLPASHRTAPIFLNVLRYLDIPQTLALVAENTRVELFQTDPALWQYPLAVVRKLHWPEQQLLINPSPPAIPCCK